MNNKRNPASHADKNTDNNDMDMDIEQCECEEHRCAAPKSTDPETIEKQNVPLAAIRLAHTRCVYLLENTQNIQPGDSVVVKTIRGKEMGKAVKIYADLHDEVKRAFACNIIKIADSRDIEADEKNRENEKEAFKACRELIQKHNLPMHLISVYYLLDKAKIIFYFKSAGKVDFRELVKDLAGVFKTRIELRQIGVRDEAKLIGGVGSCGREACCCSWLGDFTSVSIKMAKDQNLSMNSTKVSGLCGRLMCCLYYEHEFYADERKAYPKQGKSVQVNGIKYKILQIDVIQKKMLVQDEERNTRWLEGAETKDFIARWREELKNNQNQPQQNQNQPKDKQQNQPKQDKPRQNEQSKPGEQKNSDTPDKRGSDSE